MKQWILGTAAAGLLLGALAGCKKGEYRKDLEGIKMNEIQSVGSHNSYRKRVDESIYQFLLLNASSGLIPGAYDPIELDYNHITLPEQWNLHRVRSIELDVYHDPQGGRFYNRMCKAFVGEDIASNEPKLLEPGFKIIHIPDVDYNTHYLKLLDALLEIKKWSAGHPRHIPMVVMIELKVETPGDQLYPVGFVTALPITKPALDSLDMEIQTVFGSGLEGVFTPDDLRGDFGSLEAAAKGGGWPTLADARGKVVFVLMADDSQQAAYLEGHPNLAGRACFFFDEPGSPEAAFVKRDDPIDHFAEIQSLVQQGYIVRTRADAGTYEARDNDYSMQTKAFESGAQLVSSDYYMPDYRHDTSAIWSDYKTELPVFDVARPNPVNGMGLLGEDWYEWVTFEDL